MAWKVPLFDLDIADQDIDAVTRVLKSGWISMGEATKELERVFAEAHDAEYGVAVSSCTAALHLALEALDIGPGGLGLLLLGWDGVVATGSQEGRRGGD